MRWAVASLALAVSGNQAASAVTYEVTLDEHMPFSATGHTGPALARLVEPAGSCRIFRRS